MGRPAPQAQVGVVGLAGAVHPAAHHGDGEGVPLRVDRHLLDRLRQLHELLVLHARAGRARDDVELVVVEDGHGTEASGGDVGEDLPPDRDLLVLARVGQGEAHAHGVADAAREELLEGHPCLDYAFRRDARFGDAQMQRHVRAKGGEAGIPLDDLARMRVLEADHVAIEADLVEQGAVLQRGLHHGRDVVLGMPGLELGVHAPAVDADADRAVVLARDLGQEADLLADRLLTLVVVEMAGVVPHLVDVRRDGGGQPVVLLEVDHEVRARLAPDLGQGVNVTGVVHGNADEIAPSLPDRLGLFHRGVDVLRSGGAHTLDGDGVGTADEGAADAHRACGIPSCGHHVDSMGDPRRSKSRPSVDRPPAGQVSLLLFSVCFTPGSLRDAFASPAWPRWPPRPTSPECAPAAPGGR